MIIWKIWFTLLNSGRSCTLNFFSQTFLSTATTGSSYIMVVNCLFTISYWLLYSKQKHRQTFTAILKSPPYRSFIQHINVARQIHSRYSVDGGGGTPFRAQYCGSFQTKCISIGLIDFWSVWNNTCTFGLNICMWYLWYVFSDLDWLSAIDFLKLFLCTLTNYDVSSHF